LKKHSPVARHTGKNSARACIIFDIMIDGATILVADDSQDDIELLRRAFQKAGLNVPIRCLNDGEEVIDYLESNVSGGSEEDYPLLLLLDLHMPRRTGFAVLDWIRQQPHLQSFPTIIFTDSEQEKDIEHSFRLGAHGYWIKPSRFEDLVRMSVRLKDILGRVTRRVDREFPVLAAA
jgi:CheY-like chemotaxis protein